MDFTLGERFGIVVSTRLRYMPLTIYIHSFTHALTNKSISACVCLPL